MSVLSIPHPAGGWRLHATVLLLMLVPMAAVVEVGSASDHLPQLAALRTAVVAVGLLVATVSLYVHHRITGLTQSGWVCTALGLAAVPTLGFGVYAWTHVGAIPETLVSLLGYRLVQMVLMLGCLLLANRFRLPVDALALGTGLGLALLVAHQLTTQSAARPSAAASSGALVVACLVLGLVTVAVGLPLLGIVSLPVWLRARSFLSLGLLGVSTAMDPVSTTTSFTGAVGLVTAVAGSVLMASTAVAYAHLALVARERELTVLEQELARVESGSLADRVRLHEIDSTVSGIASASRLMRDTPDLTQGRRDVLAGMVATEVARLQRLMAQSNDVPEADGMPSPVDLASRRVGESTRE